MKLTESEFRNMIYEEVLNTLNDIDEGTVNPANYDNTPWAEKVHAWMKKREEKKKAQAKQPANGGAISQQQQTQTNQQQTAANNRDIAQSKTGQKQQ